MTEIVLVAAMAKDRVIGQAGCMPWHLPADLKHFKTITLGHPVVMGRRTFESIGRALPGRLNVVISRSRSSLPDGVVLADSLGAAISACGDHAVVMVIGGGEIYRQAMDRANRLELTLIDAAIDGDTHFPEFCLADWNLTAMESYPVDEKSPHALRFCTLTRP